VVERLALLLPIRVVPASNLDPDTGIPIEIPWGKCRENPRLRPLPIPSIFLPIRCSLIIPPLGRMPSELLRASQNISQQSLSLSVPNGRKSTPSIICCLFALTCCKNASIILLCLSDCLYIIPREQLNVRVFPCYLLLLVSSACTRSGHIPVLVKMRYIADGSHEYIVEILFASRAYLVKCWLVRKNVTSCR
jgi:hypothetical protein